MPVYVHVVDHPDARVLVDTGMTELHPAVADLDARLSPLNEQDVDLAGFDIVVNTHLHFDHCGGNHLFAGRPIYVRRTGVASVPRWRRRGLREALHGAGFTVKRDSEVVGADVCRGLPRALIRSPT